MARHPQLCLFFQCFLKMSSSVPQMSAVNHSCCHSCYSNDRNIQGRRFACVNESPRWEVTSVWQTQITVWSCIRGAAFSPWAQCLGSPCSSPALCSRPRDWPPPSGSKTPASPAGMGSADSQPECKAQSLAFGKKISNRSKHLSLEALLFPKRIFTPILIQISCIFKTSLVLKALWNLEERKIEECSQPSLAIKKNYKGMFFSIVISSVSSVIWLHLYMYAYWNEIPYAYVLMYM